jgi:NADH-ubiquinone oxidoreductase chain 1
LESELVSGFFTEHSSVVFIFFFLAEYASIILICILMVILFFGGYSYPFDWKIGQLNIPSLEGVLYGVSLGVKTCILVFGFIWVRASMPRLRFDQLMIFCWTVLLPLVFAFMLVVILVLVSFDAAPFNNFCLLSPGFTAYNSKRGGYR